MVNILTFLQGVAPEFICPTCLIAATECSETAAAHELNYHVAVGSVEVA